MIGILGGTFDPVHHGHLRTALEVVEALDLDQLRFVPCNRPPHRAQPGTSAQQRLRMLQVAVRGEPHFYVDQREILRSGRSYSVDTLASLRAELGATPLCFVIGMDAFLELDTWHRWRELYRLCHFVVMRRPGVGEDYGPRFGRLVETRLVTCVAALRASACGKVLVWPVTQLEISATGIRQLIQSGHSPRFLLPDAVLTLIDEWALYR